MAAADNDMIKVNDGGLVLEEEIEVLLPFMMDELVMFGDSITQFAWQRGGTGSALAEFYQRKLDVVNRGYSGYNTVWALEVAKIIFSTSTSNTQKHSKKRIVAIWLGANDSVLPNRPQHVSPDDFTQNLRSLISIIRDYDLKTSSGHDARPTQIILITPPPISVEMRAIDLSKRFPDFKIENMDREPSRTKNFAELVCKVALTEGLPVLDVWTLITKASYQCDEGLNKFLIDGLHLTADGYQIVTDGLKELIDEHLPDLLPENLNHTFPWWNDIDPLNPSKCFPHPKQ